MSRLSASGLVLALALPLGTGNAIAACASWHPLTNGSPANADDVMDNFECLTTNPEITGAMSVGGSIGIGMSASTVLDITQNQNGASQIRILNNSNGTSSRNLFAMSNGTHTAQLSMLGTGWTTAGVNTQDGALLYTDGAGGWNIATGASSPIIFTVALSPVARFGTDGSFLVNTTTNGGWSANGVIVSETASKWAGSFHNSGSGGGAILARVDQTSQSLIEFYYGTSGVASITTDGSMVSFPGLSDARLKSNVVDLSAEKAMRALRAYHPQEYFLRGRAGVGALAQDVDRRMTAIGIDAVGLGIVKRGDANTRRREGQPGFRQWGLDSSKMVPFIIASSLDHEDRLTEVEAKNEVLTRRLNDLIKTVALLERAQRNRASSEKVGKTALIGRQKDVQ